MRLQVLYHFPCPDGMTAALAAWWKLGDQADYHPVNYGGELPVLPTRVPLALLDFSLPRAQLDALVAAGHDVMVLDHHEGVAPQLEGFPGATYDPSRSGAMMAWEFFHPDRSAPAMFQYVQDRDLWRFELGDETRWFAAYLHTVPMTMEAYAEVLRESTAPKGLRRILETGKLLKDQQDALIERIITKAYAAHVAGHPRPVVVVNAPIFQSEVCEVLLARFPDADFVAAYYETGGMERWSLRSRKESGFDVSEIARRMGGNGHKPSAGFQLPRGGDFTGGLGLPYVVPEGKSFELTGMTVQETPHHG